MRFPGPPRPKPVPVRIGACNLCHKFPSDFDVASPWGNIEEWKAWIIFHYLVSFWEQISFLMVCALFFQFSNHSWLYDRSSVRPGNFPFCNQFRLFFNISPFNQIQCTVDELFSLSAIHERETQTISKTFSTFHYFTTRASWFLLKRPQ